MLKDFQPFLESCSGCGACDSVCPVFKVLGRSGPRAKMALLKAVSRKQATFSEAARALRECVLCGRCSKGCPAQISAAALFLAARQKLPKPPPAEAAFLGLLNRPGLLKRLHAPLAWLQGGLIRLEINPAHIPGSSRPLAPRPFKQNGSAGTGPLVLLFPGCISSHFLPEIAEAAIAALVEKGFAVAVPEGLMCCGRPQLSAGYKKMAAKAAAHNLAVFEKYDFEILTSPCPGCLATMADMWPDLTPDAGKIRAKIRDINLLLNEETAGPGGDIYWHRPCLLSEEADAAARSLIGAPKNTDNFCCGAPLCFGRKKTAAAQALSRAARNAIMASAARLAATACPACVLELRAALQKQGDNARVAHNLVLWAERRKN